MKTIGIWRFDFGQFTLEIEAIHRDAPIAPFFRFPALRHPPEMLKYLGERNVGIFSTDMDSKKRAAEILQDEAEPTP